VDTIGLESYLNSITLSENNPLSFEVPNASSTFAVLHGVIDDTTPTVVQNFITSYPSVTTLVFMQMPGSDDDDANLQASQLLKNRGYTTYLPAVIAYSQDAFIASGAVDMILAGNKRIIDVNGEVGVHSWSDGTNEATDFPVGHPVHLPYINYYVSMGFSQADAEAFYYFTINAAPSASIYHMTEGELEQYKLRTCTYKEMPTYTTSLNGSQLSANLSGANYQWVDCNNGNAPVNGETNQTFTASTSGDFAVQVTEANCMGISVCQAITITSIDEIEVNSINLYPNPTTNNFSIDLQAINDNALIRISSADGSILEVLESDGKEIVQVDRNFEKGLYFVSIVLNNGIKTKKLIIK
jgi:hypothetical protein